MHDFHGRHGLQNQLWLHLSCWELKARCFFVGVSRKSFLVGSFSQELNWKFKARGFLLGSFSQELSCW